METVLKYCHYRQYEMSKSVTTLRQLLQDGETFYSCLLDLTWWDIYLIQTSFYWGQQLLPRFGNAKFMLPIYWSSSKCVQQINPKLRPQTTTRNGLWRRWCNFQRVSHVSDMDLDTAMPSIANEILLLKAIALRLDYILCLICLLCLWTGLIFSSFCHFISSSFCLFV